jgi:hypothetical protein
MRYLRLTLIAAVACVCAAGVAGLASAAGSTCTTNAPGVSVDNNWGWAQWGSWGLPGQQLKYAVAIRNYDIGCSSSSFLVTLTAPSGFSVSVPSNTITLQSSSSGYVWASVTSPAGATDGDYPLTVSVQRLGATTSTASRTTYYKVYSSDVSPPTLFWSNPSDGQTVTGRSYMVNVSSSDDHAVKKIDLLIDGASVTSASCDDVTYICQLSYKWSVGRAARGQHTATFRSYDWMGNVGVSTVSFTVSK